MSTFGAVVATGNCYLPSYAQMPMPKKTKAICVGHTYQWVSDRFKIFSELTNYTDSLQYLVQATLGAATVATQGSLFRGETLLRRVNCYIDFVRTYGDICYFTNGEWLEDVRKEFYAGAVSGSLFLSSSLGSCMNLADYFRLVDLSAIAQKISNVSLFGVAPGRIMSHLVLSEFCCFASTGGFFLGAVDCWMKIKAGGLDIQQLDSKRAQLAYCVASFVAQFFFIVGEMIVAAPVAVTIAGILTVISAGFGARWIWFVEKENP